MDKLKHLFKMWFCKHEYQVVYSHDNVLSFHKCSKCGDRFTIDSRGCR